MGVVLPSLVRRAARPSGDTGTHQLTNELRLRRASAAPENTGASGPEPGSGAGWIGGLCLVGREDAPASQLLNVDMTAPGQGGTEGRHPNRESAES